MYVKRAHPELWSPSVCPSVRQTAWRDLAGVSQHLSLRTSAGGYSAYSRLTSSKWVFLVVDEAFNFIIFRFFGQLLQHPHRSVAWRIADRIQFEHLDTGPADHACSRVHIAALKKRFVSPWKNVFGCDWVPSRCQRWLEHAWGVRRAHSNRPRRGKRCEPMIDSSQCS